MGDVSKRGDAGWWGLGWSVDKPQLRTPTRRTKTETKTRTRRGVNDITKYHKSHVAIDIACPEETPRHAGRTDGPMSQCPETKTGDRISWESFSTRSRNIKLWGFLLLTSRPKRQLPVASKTSWQGLLYAAARPFFRCRRGPEHD